MTTSGTGIAGPLPGRGRFGQGGGVSSHRSFDVEGRIAVVTGSSRGIGLALATGLAETGAVVVLNGRETAALERSRDEITGSTGGAVHIRAFDATASAQVATAAKQ